MRVPKVEKFKNPEKIERRKINNVPKIEMNVIAVSDREKLKVIRNVERIVRSSIEYKMYIGFLKDKIDMTMCSYFTNVSNKDGKKISLEIHHEPFTLFDITQVVLEKHIKISDTVSESINTLKVAEEVMKLHYRNMVGLIPLSITVHKLVHNGKIFIPLQNLYGNFIKFLEEYDEYISDDLKSILELKLTMSRDSDAQDTSILEKKYVYLEVDGMSFPEIIEDTVK